MLSSSKSTLLKTSSVVDSVSKAIVEINYNSAIQALKYGCYKDYSTTYDPDNIGDLYDDGKAYQYFNTGSGYDISEYLNRNSLTPIASIFQPNRPDPGIVNLIAYRGASILTAGSLKAGNFGNAFEGERLPRVYPMSKNSRFKYWSSVKTTEIESVIETVGVSEGDFSISNSSPFAVYSDSFYINKVVVKTQTYNGYPVSFKIDVLLDGGTSWQTIYNAVDSEDLSSGILSVYFNGTSWTKTESFAQDLASPTDSIKVYAIRLSVSEMSDTRVPLEVIEISPRLQVDLSDYLLSFDKSSSIDATISGAPSSGIISGTGTISLFNENKKFSLGTENSIISKFLNPGTEIRMFQVIDGEDIPLGTFYASAWNESSDREISAELEDYFYFLKRQKAPNINIANISGIETSVATLILLDNSGITNYEFIKAYADSKDDFIMDFFFCSDEQTIADVLGDIALSSQCSIYIDVNNKIKVVTKEAFHAKRDILETDYWLVASEDWSEKDEETYLEGNYVSNVVSISEEKIAPITEMIVEFAGNGITRQPKAILDTPELFNDDIPAFYNASIVTRNLSYVNTELWSIDSAEDSDKVLLSMPYISDVSGLTTPPSIISNGGSAKSPYDLIREIYAAATAEQKKYFEIVLDQERGVEFLQAGKFNGYISVNSELIKYNGLVLDIFDPNNSANSGRKIVFSKEESQYLINSASSGVSVSVYSLLVELVYSPVGNQNGTEDEITYEFVSDGRGQENTTISSHKKTTDVSFSNTFVTRLFSGSVPAGVSPQFSVKSESVNPLDPRKPNGPKRYSYPGYLKLSGPKAISDGNKITGIRNALSGLSYLPIDNYGERFISGVSKTLNFVPSVISTRMRLVSKPLKVQSTEKSKNVSPENRGIGGIGFRLNSTSAGTTGYFIEIEDVGNITAGQLEKEIYTNLRFYKVRNIDGVLTPTVLGSAWVNVNATAGESIDLANALETEGKSYASTSDLMVTITKISDGYEYRVYWETNLVLKVKETSSVVNENSKTAGMMVRFDSVALFDHFLCLAISENSDSLVPEIFNDGSTYIKAIEAAERGVLPSVISDATVSKDNLKFDFEDFGNQVREAKKYNVKFSNPAVYASLISLDKLNKEYKVSGFSSTSYSADFWVFNTSRSSIPLSLDSSTPVIISGVALEELNRGEISLSQYLANKSGNALERILFNKNKYGENSISYSGKYINNLAQAESLLEWVWQKRSYEKRAFSVEIFPNPLLELGDKVRIFDSNIDHTIEKNGDRSYFINSISYQITQNGPVMSIGVEES